MTEPAPKPPEPPKFSDDERKRIVDALESRGAKAPCPRCGNPNFVLVDGYFAHSLQHSLQGFVIGGPAVPVAVVACQRCGWLAEHAIGVLGLLPREATK